MIRIAGVNLQSNKQARFALTPIKGVGKSNIKVILAANNIDGNIKLDDLSEEVVVKLRNYIEENFVIEADLRRQVQANIKRLIDINSWRGARHKLNLPTRGQRTKTNSRTLRGKSKKSIGSGRAKAPGKT